jgi:hypothetical protein
MMMKLLVIREQLKKIYGEKTKLIDRLIKFFAGLMSMILINTNMGVMEVLKNPVIVIVLSVVAAFLPGNVLVLLLLFFMLGHFMAISAEMALLVFLIILIMYIFYFRFCPKDYAILILMPIMFLLKIPFLIPIMAGLVATPLSIISVSFGVVIYFFINYVSVNFDTITVAASDDGFAQMMNMANGVFKSNSFLVTVIAFAVVISVVYIIRRMSVDYSYMAALVTGGILCMIIMLIGDLRFDMTGITSIASIIIGGIISIGIAFSAQFFIHSVDYSRTEYTQFEDDDYYYYVKAVPKIKITTTQINVKRINARKIKKDKR